MTINKLASTIQPLEEIAKINEIIDNLSSDTDISATAPLVLDNGVLSANIDTTVGANSDYLITSGAVQSALATKQDTLTAGTGLSLSGTTLSHSNIISAGTAGTSEASSGSTITVPYIQYDANGHVVSKGNRTHTITGFLTEHQDLSEYAKLTDIPDSISSLDNDAGYITISDLSEYALLTDIPESISAFDNDAGYLTEHQNLSEYAKLTDIPESISAFTNDVGYLTEHQDLSEYALLSDIPESVSQLANDANYITSSALSGLQDAATAVTHESNTAVGSLIKPVYITSSGAVSELSYTIAKSVPSDAQFTDTTYTAGTGISISGGVISSVQMPGLAEWGSIGGTLTDQADLCEALDGKQNVLTAGEGIRLTNNTISSIPAYTYSDTCPALTSNNGTVTWNVTHNLGTKNISCNLYYNDVEIQKTVTINSVNSVTVTFQNNSNISAGDCRIVILSCGGYPQGGKWVKSASTILNDISMPMNTQNYSLSSYLPNDGYQYEVLLSAFCNCPVNTYFALILQSSLTGEIYVVANNNNTSNEQTVNGAVTLPIGTDRQFQIVGHDWYTSTVKIYIFAAAYKKVIGF